jgi:hypothetical protein
VIVPEPKVAGGSVPGIEGAVVTTGFEQAQSGEGAIVVGVARVALGA